LNSITYQISNNTIISHDELRDRLTRLSTVDKSTGWVTTDLTISPSSLFSRILWVVLGKINCLRECFFRVNSQKTKIALENIGQVLVNTKNVDQDEKFELMTLYEEAVGNYNNKIARKHKVSSTSIVNGSLSESEKKEYLLSKTITWLQKGTNKEFVQQNVGIEIFNDAIQQLNYWQSELAKGNNVSLPTYYHSTREQNISAILKDGHIQVAEANFGVGVYVSSSDETANYGPFTIALNADCIEDQPAQYCPCPSYHIKKIRAWNYDQVRWIKLNDNIPLSKENVVYIIASADDLPRLKEHIAKNSLELVDIQTIDRRVSDVVRYAFDNTKGLSRVPDTWEPIKHHLCF